MASPAASESLMPDFLRAALDNIRHTGSRRRRPGSANVIHARFGRGLQSDAIHWKQTVNFLEMVPGGGTEQMFQCVS